jgi:glutamate-1-semialdehyde 2,1-aminomutase
LLVAGQTPLEYEAAKIITELVPAAELVRFNSSGAEAVQAALRVCRAFTGKKKIIKFEGHYHGWFDNVLWSVSPNPDDAGDPLAPTPLPGTLGQEEEENLIVLPWNNADVIERELAKGDVAAVIMEPIMFNTGGVLPLPGYLERVRELTTKYGAVFIFDEVITGFRVSSGGAQRVLGITPDLTILGKALANGFAVAAIVGKKEIMDLIGEAKVMHGGTYNSQSVSMAATVATLKLLQSEAPHQAIAKTGTALMEGLRELFTKHGVAHEIVGYPAVFNVRFDLQGPTDYRSAMKANRAKYLDFAFELLQRGVRILPRGTWFLSSAHTDSDIAKTLATVDEVLGLRTT